MGDRVDIWIFRGSVDGGSGLCVQAGHLVSASLIRSDEMTFNGTSVLEMWDSKHCSGSIIQRGSNPYDIQDTNMGS